MSIRSEIEHFFEKYPNEKHFLKDIAQHLGHEERQIQQSISWMIRNESPAGLEAIHKGQCWIYHLSGATAQDILTKIGETKKGSLILEDAESNLWIARKFEE